MSDLKALTQREQVILTFSDGTEFTYDPTLDAYPVAVRVERTVTYEPSDTEEGL